MPKATKIFAKVGQQFCQVLNSYLRNGQKIFKILPKWRNFAKSGNTANTIKIVHSDCPKSMPKGLQNDGGIWIKSCSKSVAIVTEKVAQSL